MKGFKNKPAVLPAAEPSAAKFGEDEAAPETRGEARLEGGAEDGIAATRKSGLEVGCHPGCTLNRKTAGRWCE